MRNTPLPRESHRMLPGCRSGTPSGRPLPDPCILLPKGSPAAWEDGFPAQFETSLSLFSSRSGSRPGPATAVTGANGKFQQDFYKFTEWVMYEIYMSKNTDSTLLLTDTYSGTLNFLCTGINIQNQRPPAGSLRNTKSQNINMKNLFIKRLLYKLPSAYTFRPVSLRYPKRMISLPG